MVFFVSVSQFAKRWLCEDHPQRGLVRPRDRLHRIRCKPPLQFIHLWHPGSFYGFLMIPMWSWLNYVGINSLTHHNTSWAIRPNTPVIPVYVPCLAVLASSQVVRLFVALSVFLGDLVKGCKSCDCSPILERGGAKGRWGHISQQLFALILFQYRTFPSP